MKRTSIPGTTFDSCPQMEIERIAYQCAVTASGFYRRREYLITPKIIPQYRSRCVVMPEFVRHLSKEFWNDAVKGAKTMPIRLTQRMKDEIGKYDVGSVSPELVDNLSREWQKVQDRYWEFLNTIMSDKAKWIGSLEVRVTQYSKTSHYLLERKNGQHLIINLREDGNVAELARIIIVALLWPDRKKWA